MTNAEHYRDEIAEWMAETRNCNTCPARKYCVNNGSKFNCVKKFTEWMNKDYDPAIEKHTRQEWANFTGMYPEKDQNGRVYLFPVKEAIIKGLYTWNSNLIMNRYIEITDKCIPDDLPWDTLIEPHKLYDFQQDLIDELKNKWNDVYYNKGISYTLLFVCKNATDYKQDIAVYKNNEPTADFPAGTIWSVPFNYFNKKFSKDKEEK